MQTYTGRAFWPLDPRPEEVHIEDIAHALSYQCRYAGHCRYFWSVAAHSLQVERWVRRSWVQSASAWALMHDAAEAYLVDLPRPVKRCVSGYAEAEERVAAAIADRFKIARSGHIEHVVGVYDTLALHAERRAMMAEPPIPWTLDVADDGRELDDDLIGCHPREIRSMFLLRFRELLGETA